MQFLRKFFDTNERDVDKYRKVVDKINAMEPQIKKLSDEELRAKTTEFQEKIQKVFDAECKKRDKTWEELDRVEKRAIGDLALDPTASGSFRRLPRSRPPQSEHAAIRRAVDRRHGSS